MATQAHQFNSSLLSKSIDDIEDLPGFEVPTPGMYSLKFSTQVKVVKDRDCVEANFEVIECLEQNDPAEKAAIPGTKFSMLFQLDNPIAEGKMKELMIPIAEAFGERNMLTLITETCAVSQGVIIAAKVTRRPDKEDKDKFYAVVSQVTLA